MDMEQIDTQEVNRAGYPTPLAIAIDLNEPGIDYLLIRAEDGSVYRVRVERVEP